MNNLVTPTPTEHQAALERLCRELEKWTVAWDEQGRIPGPSEVTANRGATKIAAPGANPAATPDAKKKTKKQP